MATTFTVREVAGILKLGTAKVYRLARSGDLPCVLLDGQFRFTAAAIRKRLNLGPEDEIVVPPEKREDDDDD